MDYGWLSLLPPMVAVVMAIRSRNVILSLFCGGFVGTMIFCMGNPFLAVKSMIGDYFFVQLTDSYNAGVIVLVIFIFGYAAIVSVTSFIRAQMIIQYSISQAAREISAYCYLVSKTGIMEDSGRVNAEAGEFKKSTVFSVCFAKRIRSIVWPIHL